MPIGKNEARHVEFYIRGLWLLGLGLPARKALNTWYQTASVHDNYTQTRQQYVQSLYTLGRRFTNFS
jgi:hypothetical protein